MRRRILCSYGLGFLFAAVSAYAQQDYFTALKTPDPTGYLQQVDTFHTDKVPDSIRIGRLDQAMLDLNYTLERFPNHPKALQFVGIVAQLRKQTSVAISYYEKAITLFPQYALTHAQYGFFLVTIGNLNEGIEKLKHAVEMDPNLGAGHAGLAHAYARKGDMEAAREAAKMARELGFHGALPPGL